MTRHWSIFFAAVIFGAGVPVMAATLAPAPVPAIPTALIPTVQCVHSVLKSSSTVRSISLYSIDGFRFATEYVFRNKDDPDVVFDIEFYALGGSVTESNKIPREVSMESASEAQSLESQLSLASKCHLNPAFDNLIPQPKPRADWQKIDWPSGGP
jgi:hypothetical protein